MQNSCIRQLISATARNKIIPRANISVNVAQSKDARTEHSDAGLICSAWEEAIIKEYRSPDISIEMLQKQTIEMINNKYLVQQAWPQRFES